MGVKKVMLRRGWLYDENAPNKKGKQFDTSVGRGDMITPVGVGRVILGWDQGILGSAKSSPMTLGEKATLVISADYGYGDNDVELKSINGKRA
ncbi:hypothetical protein IQ06DRAFT_344626 [Phaeosphaeriaceae sp. SRC1lsM3a]|nr:hypothetical protein IQ06DRAFT_344626 [Stagonospora sp. SRC1lsM3a]